MSEQHSRSSGYNPVGPGTHIIRRAPTAAMPVATGAPGSPNRIPSGLGPAAGPTGTAALPTTGAAVPIAAAAAAILSGWATSVVATDLITGWWRTDRLFCSAVGFLTVVFAATTIPGVILLLRRRPLGRYLIAVGAAVGLLTFGSLFIAGARVPWVVHAIPVLQATSGVLALHPATKRWLPAD